MSGHSRGHGLALLLLVAVLLRGLVPAGWMPNTAGAGTTPIVVCTAGGAEVVWLDGKGHPAKPGHGGRHDVCAFAGHAAAPAPDAAIAVSAPLLYAQTAWQPAVAAPPAPERRHRDQAARAPPPLI